ncbi:MAG: acetate kinase [Sedimentisphaerales bacterium]|nr:acetate kinase [Sedimentisphaerales bacterium]
MKYQVHQMPQNRILAQGEVDRIGEQDAELRHTIAHKEHRQTLAMADHQAAISLILKLICNHKMGVVSDLKEIEAVGHRVVHGGDEVTGSVLVDDDVVAAIEDYTGLAPLHIPPELEAIQTLRFRLPDTPHVACFDTAFHQTIPKVAHLYALPRELYEVYGIRKYGFHGLSHRYVVSRAAELLGRRMHEINAITCHLGNGSSVTAIRNGRSVDTSMGFTPLDGLVMGSRPGNLDPGVLLYLSTKGYETKRLNEILNKRSGLFGLSGISNDMRQILTAAENGHERAQLAVDIFCYRLRKYIGAYTVILGRLDVLAFSGGIGENASRIRSETCKDLEQIGIEIDEDMNMTAVNKEADVSASTSRVKVLIIPSDEASIIAGDTYELAKGCKICPPPIHR